MKMVKCKKCGNEYLRKLKKCPECKTRTPVSVARKILATLLSLIAVFTAIVVITATGDDTEPTAQLSSSQTEETQISNDTSKTNKEKVIYSDSNVKVSFIKVADASDYGVGVTACYIYLKVENVGSKTYTVSLTEAYANDSAVTVMSGMPMTLSPGKNSKQPFMFGYNNILTSAAEVEKLEFKIMLLDENLSIIETTQNITVDVK